MFSAIRVARPLARSVYKNSALRSFASSARALDDHGHTVLPQIYGPRSKPREVPTDELQSTGLERLQVLGEMQGVNVFDKSPLDSSRVGTKASPIIVPSLVSYPYFNKFSYSQGLTFPS
jgi:cytochrome c oxidase subunit 5b